MSMTIFQTFFRKPLVWHRELARNVKNWMILMATFKIMLTSVEGLPKKFQSN